MEAKQAKKDAANAVHAEKFAEAKRTGKPVKLASWTEECMSQGRVECDLDIVTQWAMPDGTTKTDSVHTY